MSRRLRAQQRGGQVEALDERGHRRPPRVGGCSTVTLSPLPPPSVSILNELGMRLACLLDTARLFGASSRPLPSQPPGRRAFFGRLLPAFAPTRSPPRGVWGRWGGKRDQRLPDISLLAASVCDCKGRVSRAQPYAARGQARPGATTTTHPLTNALCQDGQGEARNKDRPRG